MGVSYVCKCKNAELCTTQLIFVWLNFILNNNNKKEVENKVRENDASLFCPLSCDILEGHVRLFHLKKYNNKISLCH